MSADVKDEQMLDIFIRSDYPRDEDNSNKKLFIFMLFENQLYSWDKGAPKIEFVTNT